MADDCPTCRGELHVPSEDGTCFVRCPTCFPTTREPSVLNIPSRFRASTMADVKKLTEGAPEFLKVANSVVNKTVAGLELKKTPLLVGHEEHTLLLVAATMNEASSRSSVDCVMLTLGRLQHAFFNDKADGFYAYADRRYELASVQIGGEIVNAASSHVLRELLSERRNRGANTIVVTEVHPRQMTREGFPPDMVKLLQDEIRFLAVEVDFGRRDEAT